MELLSPAGGMKQLHAAVLYGADAVYIGGAGFSARSYAANFTMEELAEAVDYCHLRGAKLYLAINTLVKDAERKDFFELAARGYELGVDAFIMQDLGMAGLIKKAMPDIPLHASTQLTAASLEDALFLKAQGFDRVILSRELSLEEIKNIAKNSGIEVECFVHGALCVSYSGRCLMSSFLGGRSGNRGRCAQPCRLPYTLYHGYDKILEGNLLSPKDIRALGMLSELESAGVAAVKLEGRMKNPQYVAGVTGVYRKYLDMPSEKSESADEKILAQLFNRGGFTEGYFKNHSGADMMSLSRTKSVGLLAGHIDKYDPKSKRVTMRTREPFVPGDGIEVWTEREPHPGCNITKSSKAGEVISFVLEGDIKKNQPVYKTYDKHLSDELDAGISRDTRKLSVKGSARIAAGEPMSLYLEDERGISVSVLGEAPQIADKSPVGPERIAAQLKKTGAAGFEISSLKLDCADNIYIGISALNSLRRSATDELSKKIAASYRRERPQNIFDKKPASKKRVRKLLNVGVSKLIQFKEALNSECVNIIILEPNMELLPEFSRLIDEGHSKGKEIWIALPAITRDIPDEKKRLENILSQKADGFLIRAMGQKEQVKATGRPFAVDYCLNVFNSEAAAFWREQGAKRTALSPELNVRELKFCADRDSELFIYGYVPLMTTVQCPIGTANNKPLGEKHCKLCGKSEGFSLRDRKGERFPIITDCVACMARIMNVKPLFALKFFDEIDAVPAGFVRADFTLEGVLDTRQILEGIEAALSGKEKAQALRTLVRKMGDNESTKGHYFRGVE
ncbi:MAG: U32 family peptidase [Firmicutes bacterium]|nr:U32 family peptidase [Bacillota bacterium]